MDSAEEREGESAIADHADIEVSLFICKTQACNCQKGNIRKDKFIKKILEQYMRSYVINTYNNFIEREKETANYLSA